MLVILAISLWYFYRKTSVVSYYEKLDAA